VIRPFHISDVLLIQRLSRQITRLNTIQTLLQPQSAVWSSLTAVAPWHDGKVATYVLRQPGHGLVGDGFLQVRKRPGRPELEIVCVAPGLDAPHGHPVIWEKLLAHHNVVATQQQIARIYVDVPDQPLPVHTLGHVGFRPYAREAIWRLPPHRLSGQPYHRTVEIRTQNKADDWTLQQLYMRTTPREVQLAEGLYADQPVRAPVLEWWQVGVSSTHVLEQGGEVVGAVQVAQGRSGYWVQPWADFNAPDSFVVDQLIRHALTTVGRRGAALPVYIGVRDYQGSLGTLLTGYGFAPFTDRAKLVRPVVQWARESALETAPVLEPAAHVVAAPFTVPVPPGRPLGPALQPGERARLA
jgi:hypothetical protein